ncbi:MAG: cell division protein ZipA C-terminal FtsZ-binding domain-containing protein [Nitrosospira sp.]
MGMVNLSELQISLIAIGFVVVMGVLFFNWMQQRRYRRGAEEAFARKHEDVLLRTDKSFAEDERIEPQLGKDILQEQEIFQELPAEPKEEPAEPVEPVSLVEIVQPNREAVSTVPEVVTSVDAPVSDGGVLDMVDYVVNIRGQTPITASDMTEVLQRKFDFNKPVQWLGKRETDALWEEIALETSVKGGYGDLRGRLQLVDRAGPVSEVSLSEFRDMVRNFATHVNAVADCPDVRQAYAQALSLDQFCAEVDVMIGINIISRDNSVFTGAKIRVLAEASGFRFGTEGVFTYRDESNSVLFSLNNHESSPFLPDTMRTLTTHGITFLLEVPRITNGEKVFGEMMHVARSLSDTLGGIMVDDNHAPLSDSGIGKIKRQLIAIQSMMLARNIPAGGEIALRLFA